MTDNTLSDSRFRFFPDWRGSSLKGAKRNSVKSRENCSDCSLHNPTKEYKLLTDSTLSSDIKLSTGGAAASSTPHKSNKKRSSWACSVCTTLSTESSPDSFDKTDRKIVMVPDSYRKLP